MKIAKWIGGLIGWFLGGAIGAVIGFWIGLFFDSIAHADYSNQKTKKKKARPFRLSEEYFITDLITLTAFVFKADGQLKRNELDYIRKYFIGQFGREKAGKYMLLLRDMVKSDIDLEPACLKIKLRTSYYERLHLFHFLFGIVKADGVLKEEELATLLRIAGLIGLYRKDYVYIENLYRKKKQRTYSFSSSRYPMQRDYEILGISENASNETIKKAYRELAKKYHPDKVAHLGEAVRKQATEKFQEIQSAYEKIKKSRGF
jgi:DnaJ like chaperone protein